MSSPYDNPKYFYLHGIPFLPLAKRGKAVNCRIGLSRQLVFLPEIYFNEDLTLKDGADLEWFYKKRQTQCKIKCYKKEEGIYDTEL